MQDAEEDLKAEQQKVLQGLGQRMMAVIEKYAKDNGYTLILDVSNRTRRCCMPRAHRHYAKTSSRCNDKTSTGGARLRRREPARPPAGQCCRPGPA